MTRLGLGESHIAQAGGVQSSARTLRHAITVNVSLPRRLCVNPRWLIAFISGLHLREKMLQQAKKSEKTDSQKSVKYI